MSEVNVRQPLLSSLLSKVRNRFSKGAHAESGVEAALESFVDLLSFGAFFVE